MISRPMKVEIRSRPRQAGVNFINIKHANFSYEGSFWLLFSSYMYIKKTTFVRKISTFNFDEIDGRVQFMTDTPELIIRSGREKVTA